jgi:hypothetical protein
VNGDGRLDGLLRAPLGPIEDAGFSTHVAARISVARERQNWLEGAGLVAASALVLAFLPLGPFSNWIGNLSDGVANSVPLAAATLALVLTVSWARLLAD